MNAEKTLFVVDNDLSMLRAVQRLLTRRGFQVVLFNSANELRHYNQFEQAICIVINVDLSAESGITLHQELRGRVTTSPVICTSGKQAPAVADLFLVSH